MAAPSFKVPYDDSRYFYPLHVPSRITNISSIIDLAITKLCGSRPQSATEHQEWMLFDREYCHIESATDLDRLPAGSEIVMVKRNQALLRRMDGEGQAALRGTIFESIAHRLISNYGCCGMFRCLEENARDTPSPRKRRRTNTHTEEKTFGPYPFNFFHSTDDILQNSYNIRGRGLVKMLFHG